MQAPAWWEWVAGAFSPSAPKVNVTFAGLVGLPGFECAVTRYGARPAVRRAR